MNTVLRRYVGDRQFYKMVLLLVIPIIVQQGITNFVNLLDNVMVGALGTEPMSGVSIANQLIFVYNLCIFGALSGAGIFGAQFFGTGDYDGMRSTAQFRLIIGALITAVAVVVLCLWGGTLSALFLDNEANADTDISVTLNYAIRYLRIMCWGLLPSALVQVYAGTLRESGQTVAPMVAGICAIVVNLSFNYILIFGHFGFPRLGIAGAAIATVLSRYVELCIVVVFAHRNMDRYPFFRGLYTRIHLPLVLVRRIALTSLPLFVNEALWSLGVTFINRNYSTRGLTVVAALNIEVTVWSLFSIIMMAMGSAVSILVGQKLGAGEIEAAKDTDRKLLFFTFTFHVFVGLLIILCSGLFPLLYNTEPEVRQLASRLLIVSGLSLPLHAFVHSAYFTIRSGGRTFITMLFDSVYTWCVPATLSYVLCRFTALPIVSIFFLVQFSEIIKVFISIPMLRSGFWARNLVKLPED